MTLKKVFDEESDQKSKRLKLFYKKRVNKSVNSVIKKEFSDSENRRVQIRAVSRWTSFLTVELKFNRLKLRLFIASISSLTAKEFARIQRNKNREKLK